MNALLAHLDGQVESAQRLLRILLAQSEAIKRQDAEGVLARLGDVQAELATRERLEREREQLLSRVGARLGRVGGELHLEDVLALATPEQAQEARAKSAELRGLMKEIERVHAQNRVLVRQELTFLDHLMRVLSGAPQGGYSPNGYATAAPASTRAVDTRA